MPKTNSQNLRKINLQNENNILLKQNFIYRKPFPQPILIFRTHCTHKHGGHKVCFIKNRERFIKGRLPYAGHVQNRPDLSRREGMLPNKVSPFLY